MTEACPNCSNKLKLAGTDVGSVLVCGLCVEILVVGSDLTVRHATPTDIAAFPPGMRVEIETFQKGLLLQRTQGNMPS